MHGWRWRLCDRLRALPHMPDVLLVNATGRDHPRGAGLALHVGAAVDVPTVGVTHRPLLAVGPSRRRGPGPYRRSNSTASWSRPGCGRCAADRCPSRVAHGSRDRARGRAAQRPRRAHARATPPRSPGRSSRAGAGIGDPAGSSSSRRGVDSHSATTFEPGSLAASLRVQGRIRPRSSPLSAAPVPWLR